VRIATYNLLHGLPVLAGGPSADLPAGTGPAQAEGRDDAPLRAAVTALDADVLGVQEADSAQPRSGGHHQVQAAAQAMGAPHWLFAPSVLGTPGAGPVRWQRAGTEHVQRSDHAEGAPSPACGQRPLYGVGLVSRLPVLSWRTTCFDPAPFALPLLVHAHPRSRVMLVPDEPRTAVAAVLQGPSGTLTVATVHLSFVPGHNVRQLRRLVAWLADLPRPLILVGDLNLPGRLPARVTGWTALARGATYPVLRPRAQLDHVLADGLSTAQVTTTRAQVHPLPVSDHAAVTVDIDL
jgi:endonuclease/exonuclease/phosphatase family metal-dependent hydrolase